MTTWVCRCIVRVLVKMDLESYHTVPKDLNEALTICHCLVSRPRKHKRCRLCWHNATCRPVWIGPTPTALFGFRKVLGCCQHKMQSCLHPGRSPQSFWNLQKLLDQLLAQKNGYRMNSSLLQSATNSELSHSILDRTWIDAKPGDFLRRPSRRVHQVPPRVR